MQSLLYLWGSNDTKSVIGISAMTMTQRVAIPQGRKMKRRGWYRRKYHVRALCQSVAFVCVLAGFCLYNGVDFFHGTITGGLTERPSVDYGIASVSRDLHELTSYPKQPLSNTFAPTGITEQILNNSMNSTNKNSTASGNQCSGVKKADPKWMLVFYALGVLYMFLALAVVCDEFFVPALEEMSSSRRLNLSMDVAGATLMAAGGSAPELFTNMFGTFRRSEVGFGTIIGSAVFNVLFVIALCALMSKEVLELTWWPLFRDSLYYAIGLSVLTIFIGVTSKSEIEVWESVVLFILYLGYIAIMWQNANIYKAITGKELECPDEEDGEDDADKGGVDPESPQTVKPLSARDINATLGKTDSAKHFRWHGTFRAGILKLLRDPESWVETAGVGIVAKIAGDADYVFRQIDTDGNGSIDRSELRRLFEVLDCNLSDQELESVFKELDANGDGEVRIHIDHVHCNGPLKSLFALVAMSFAFTH